MRCHPMNAGLVVGLVLSCGSANDVEAPAIAEVTSPSAEAAVSHEVRPNAKPAAPLATLEPSEASAKSRAKSDDDDLLLRTRREKRVPGKPEWIESIDVDGDGAKEVVATTHTRGNLLLWRSAHAATEYIGVGDYPLRPAALPRGAGKSALVAVASRADKSLVLFDLSKAGAPTTVLSLELADRPMVLEAGVLDEARGAELLVVTRSGQLLRVNESGIESEQKLVSSVPRCAKMLEPEVGFVVGFQESDTLELYRAQSGSDELEHRASFKLPATARDVLGIDLDGDGDQELIAIEGDIGGWIFGVNGNELFGTDPAPLRFLTTAVPIRLRPLPDQGPSSWGVLAAKSVACEIWDWVDGAPKRRSFNYAGQTPTDFVTSDADGIAPLDFWVTNRDATTISILLNDEAGPVEPIKVHVGNFPNDMAVGDIDGDGVDEIFVIDAKDTQVSVLLGGGREGRSAFRVQTGLSPRAIQCVDLDGDGERDLVWLERIFEGTRINLRMGDGTGDLVVPTGFETFPFGVGARDFVVEDFNQVSKRYLVAADIEGRRILWTSLERAGAGVAFVGQGELMLPKAPQSIATLSSNGKAQGVAVAMPVELDRSLVQMYVPREQTDGSLEWDMVGQETVSGCVEDIATGDLNGDGTSDIVVLGSDSKGSVGGHIVPLLVRGNRLQSLGFLNTGLRPMRVRMADMNGDGLAEVFVANLDSHNVSAWTTVKTEDSVTLRVLDDVGAGVGCIALATSDLDLDGDMDLIVVDSANNGVSLIFNETH